VSNVGTGRATAGGSPFRLDRALVIEIVMPA
jgi:hypothetical protein